jgi:hypothetical protein
MSHGTKLGQVDPQFANRVLDLEAKARSMAEQFNTQTTYRLWHTPPGTGDPLDVPALHVPAWERNDINELYSEKILGGVGKDSGTVGDLIAMKWQADFMAVEERAFRTRHASFVRCQALAHGRLKGHGTAGAGVFSVLREATQSTIDGGGTTGNDFRPYA